MVVSVCDPSDAIFRLDTESCIHRRHSLFCFYALQMFNVRIKLNTIIVLNTEHKPNTKLSVYISFVFSSYIYIAWILNCTANKWHHLCIGGLKINLFVRNRCEFGFNSTIFNFISFFLFQNKFSNNSWTYSFPASIGNFIEYKRSKNSRIYCMSV